MKTKVLILILTAFLSACVNTSHFDTSTTFPNPPPPPPETLEPIPIGGLPNGMKWTRKEGPDFYIHEASNERSGVMMYIGRHPNYEPSNEEISIPGTIGREKCEWIRRKEIEHDILEALIPCPLTSDDSGIKLHAVIWGAEEDLITIKKALESVDFGLTEINQTMEGEQVGGHNSGKRSALTSA